MPATSQATESGAFIARLSATPLDVAALIAEVQRPRCGGLVLFSGDVRLPGEPAVHLITLATHRAEAYQANQHIMRRVKHEAAIWKKEVYADGSHLWGHHCDH